MLLLRICAYVILILLSLVMINKSIYAQYHGGIGQGYDSAAFGGTISGGTTNAEVYDDYIPKEYILHQNYPNPFNPQTTIKYDIPERSTVTIQVYNVVGQQVMTLINEVQDPGSFSIVFDGSHISSGIYIYTMKAGEFVKRRKMLLIR